MDSVLTSASLVDVFSDWNVVERAEPPSSCGRTMELVTPVATSTIVQMLPVLHRTTQSLCDEWDIVEVAEAPCCDSIEAAPSQRKLLVEPVKFDLIFGDQRLATITPRYTLDVEVDATSVSLLDTFPCMRRPELTLCCVPSANVIVGNAHAVMMPALDAARTESVDIMSYTGDASNLPKVDPLHRPVICHELQAAMRDMGVASAEYCDIGMDGCDASGNVAPPDVYHQSSPIPYQPPSHSYPVDPCVERERTSKGPLSYGRVAQAAPVSRRASTSQSMTWSPTVRFLNSNFIF